MVDTSLRPRPAFSTFLQSDNTAGGDDLSLHEYQRYLRSHKVALLQEKRSRTYAPGYSKPKQSHQQSSVAQAGGEGAAASLSRRVFRNPAYPYPGAASGAGGAGSGGGSAVVAHAQLAQSQPAENHPGPAVVRFEEQQPERFRAQSARSYQSRVNGSSVLRADDVTAGKHSKTHRERPWTVASTRDAQVQAMVGPGSTTSEQKQQLTPEQQDVKPVPSPVQASSWIEVSRQHRHALTHRKPTTMGLLGRQSKDGSSGIAHSTSESSALLLHGHGSSPPKQQNLSEDARDHTCVESTAPSTQMVAPVVLPPDDGLADRDQLAKAFVWTTATQRSYNEVGWEAKLPRPLSPSTTSHAHEAVPDQVTYRLNLRRYHSAPATWQRVNTIWDFIQTRTQEGTPGTNFCSPFKQSCQLPGYLKANIPGYTGRTHWSSHAPAHNNMASPEPTTTARVHRHIPLEEEQSPFCRTGVFSKTVSLVSPYNHFNKIQPAK